MSKDTLIVNLLAGAGCGKSTTAARVFADLKEQGVDVELVTEYAKDLVWEERTATFNNELYIFAKENHRLFRVNGKVDVIVTDAPLLLKLRYMPKDLDFSDLVLQVHNQYRNLNFVLKRVAPYNPNGRMQTAEEAAQDDARITSLLLHHDIPFVEVTGNRLGAELIVEKILQNL